MTKAGLVKKFGKEIRQFSFLMEQIEYSLYRNHLILDIEIKYGVAYLTFLVKNDLCVGIYDKRGSVPDLSTLKLDWAEAKLIRKETSGK